MTAKVREVQLYTPHQSQMALHNCEARFRILSCGRRWGKTLGASNELSKNALEIADTLNWWVAPTYSQANIAFELMANALYPILKKDPNYTKLRLDLINKSVIECRSAEKYNNLRGNGPDACVIDEARDIKKEAWYEVLRPAMADKQGWVIFISTPRGYDWFYDLFRSGQDPLNREYASFTFPMSANPYIPQSEIDELRHTLPERTFRQEVLAEFLEDASNVFHGVDRCVDGTLEEPKPGHTYIIGWDPAKHEDFSVMTCLNVDTRHVDAFYRTNQIDYTFQIHQLAELSYRYNQASVLMDSTGVGDPLLEMVRMRGIAVDGFLFTNVSKKELIERLVIAIEQRQVTFPGIDELLGELRSFEYTLTASRNVSYAAPQGQHDDAVISLALAYYAVARPHIPLSGADIPDEEKPAPLTPDEIARIDPFQWVEAHLGGDW